MGPGGSAKQARDRRFQAILPLRGKILNVERKDDASLYKNNEISNLIVGLGLGLKGEDVTNLRYGKVSCPTTSCAYGSPWSCPVALVGTERTSTLYHVTASALRKLSNMCFPTHQTETLI